MQYPIDTNLQYCYCNKMDRDTRSNPAGFVARVEAAREKHGLGVYDFSEKLDLAGSYWSSWMSRHKKRETFPSGDIMAKMTEVLGVSMDYLLGKSMGNPTPASLPEIQTVPLAALLRRVGAQPVYGEYVEDLKASAGRRGSRIPQGFDESRPRKGRAGKTPERIQVVEVEGHCMETLIYPGDLVHVDTQRTPAIGDITVAVRFHDETIVKFLREKEGHQFFEGVDGTIVPLDQYTRILGPMVWLQISTARLLRGGA